MVLKKTQQETFMEFIKGGAQYINALIEEALKNGNRSIRISGDYEIDDAIRIPSDFTVILADAHLRLADGSHTNIFVNCHNDTEIGKTLDGTDRNITIIGEGRAVLDGGEMNDVHERVPFDKRVAPLYKNNLILFTNVDGFKISGLRLINQRYWATNFVFCRNGYIGNLDFLADDRMIDDEGNITHGIVRDSGKKILVRNADGVDLRMGCQNIVIENLTGFTEDDTVALTCLPGRMEEQFSVEGLSSDIANIKIRNIRSATYCTNVRLLNQGETKLHDIEIDGVYDDSEGSPHINKGNFAIRIGDRHLYGPRLCTKEETYNISINNVYGRGNAVIALAGEIGNLTVTNISAAEGTPIYYTWENYEDK